MRSRRQSLRGSEDSHGRSWMSGRRASLENAVYTTFLLCWFSPKRKFNTPFFQRI
jgi:hypothetical protein